MSEHAEVSVEIDALVAHQDRRKLADKLHRLIEQFLKDVDTYTAEQAATFDQVIGRLAEDLDHAARAEIAEWLAREPKAPPGVVRRLAADDHIEVAEPVLLRSEHLDEETLLVIVAGHSQSHLLAVSRRERVAERLTDALLHKGNQSVVRALGRNAGAAFSPEGAKVFLRRSLPRRHEQRRSPRKEVSYRAAVMPAHGGSPQACTLLDISATGARIRLAAPARLSAQLTLSLAGDVSRACELVWQDGRMAGLRFRPAEAEAAAAR